MSQKIRSFFLACAFALTPALAVNPTLQVSTPGWSGQTVIVSVHNANAIAVTGHVQVGVLLADGTLATLTSAEFIAPAGATISLTLSATQPVVGIEDDPEPYGVSALE